MYKLIYFKQFSIISSFRTKSQFTLSIAIILSTRERPHHLPTCAHTLGHIISRQISKTQIIRKYSQRLQLGCSLLIYITDPNPSVRLGPPLAVVSCSKWLLKRILLLDLHHHKAHPQTQQAPVLMLPSEAESGFGNGRPRNGQLQARGFVFTT